MVATAATMTDTPVRCECCDGTNDIEWCIDSEDDDVVVALCAVCRVMLSVEEL
jgi:hypothetical protein